MTQLLLTFPEVSAMLYTVLRRQGHIAPIPFWDAVVTLCEARWPGKSK